MTKWTICLVDKSSKAETTVSVDTIDGNPPIQEYVTEDGRIFDSPNLPNDLVFLVERYQHIDWLGRSATASGFWL